MTYLLIGHLTQPEVAEKLSWVKRIFGGDSRCSCILKQWVKDGDFRENFVTK